MENFWELRVGWSGGGVRVGVVGGWFVLRVGSVGGWRWPCWREGGLAWCVGSGVGLGRAGVPALPFGCRILNNFLFDPTHGGKNINKK